MNHQPQTINTLNAFGMPMLGRSYTSENYRFGFNTQEKTDEIAGVGNHYTAEFWEYSPRVVHRWNIDPVVKEWESPYAINRGSPILYNDIKGNHPGIVIIIAGEAILITSTEILLGLAVITTTSMYYRLHQSNSYTSSFSWNNGWAWQRELDKRKNEEQRKLGLHAKNSADYIKDNLLGNADNDNRNFETDPNGSNWNKIGMGVVGILAIIENNIDFIKGIINENERKIKDFENEIKKINSNQENRLSVDQKNNRLESLNNKIKILEVTNIKLNCDIEEGKAVYNAIEKSLSNGEFKPAPLILESDNTQVSY